MKSRALALGASIPLTVLAVIAAWRSLERLYTAYLIAQGRRPWLSDDLTQARINLSLELEAWGIVLGIVVVIFFLLRFWRRSGRQLA